MQDLYLIQRETLDNLADEVRELSGTDSSLTTKNMIDKISEANANIENESNLITTINEVLAGKANPEPPQLILNKIDSIGTLQGDGSVSEAFTHTFQFSDSVKSGVLTFTQPIPPSYTSAHGAIALDPLAMGTWTMGHVGEPGDYPGKATWFREGSEKLWTLKFETFYKPNTTINKLLGYMKLIVWDVDGNIDFNEFSVPYIWYTCYLKNTLISLANNQTKKVQDVSYEDSLLVWDFDNGYFTSAKPLWIKKAEMATQYYHCVFENGIKIDLVGGRNHAHRIFCLDTNRFEYANNCVGKIVMTQKGPTKLISCDIIEDVVEYYNIITDYHMNVYANEVLTSTGFSNIYPVQDMKYIKENRELIPIEAFENCPQYLYDGLRLGEQVEYSMERMNEKIQTLVDLALPNGD